MSIAAILRCFDNPEIRAVVGRLAELPGVTRVVVVIDSARDGVGTPQLLARSAWPIPVHAVTPSFRGWAAALNAGLTTLQDIGATESLALMISAEVTLDATRLQALQRAACRPDTSCGYARFEGRDEASYRVPRNTCCLWSRELLDQLGGFDESGDEDGGMEDYALALTAHEKTGRLPRLGPRAVPLKRRADDDLQARLEWEIRGMRAAEARHPQTSVLAVRARLGM